MILPAIVSAAALLAVAVAVGRPADTWTWATDVLPEVSKGGLLVNNQSIPAWVARLFGSNLHWLNLEADLGAWRFIAFVVMIVGLAAVYLVRRGTPFAPLELGAMILVALLAGPVTWDHYPTWAIVTLMLVVDLRYWERRRRAEIAVLAALLVGATGLMWKLTQYPTAQIVASDWTRRVESGSKTIAMLAYLAVVLWLLARPPNDVAPEGGRETPARRLESPEIKSGEATTGEKGVHARR